jgi:ABC-type transport system involved in cytochrome c biogenesis permease subunit
MSSIKFIFLTITFLISYSFANEFAIGDIPIQNEGRIKPLDTFARNQLLVIHGKRALKDDSKLSAMDWMLEIWIHPETAKNRKVFNIRNPKVAEALSIKKRISHQYSFNEVWAGISGNIDNFREIFSKREENWTLVERQLSEQYMNVMLFNQLLDGINSEILTIIPHVSLNAEMPWIAPKEIAHQPKSNLKYKQISDGFSNILLAVQENDEPMLQSALIDYEKLIFEGFEKAILSAKILKKEVWYNNADLFYNSIAFYIIAFILLSISWVTAPKWLYRFSFISLVFGFLAHTYGLYMRMVIMNRPPVSTLYETVIFVGFTAVFVGLILEYYRKDGLGLFVGTVSGAVFHFISFGYAADGDTLGMLVAVLDSNFWLATHVTTITIGYGASMVAGFMGHIYLVQAIRTPNDKPKLSSIDKNVMGITIFALFFTLFGTILGGIWADQSWGRFWGWDPKENGALLIVLWQIMMLHFRVSGMAKPAGFALGMIMNNIVVVIAWFGVNLLNIGLHSYGFAGGIAKNLAIFIALELIIGFGTYYWAVKKGKTN